MKDERIRPTRPAANRGKKDRSGTATNRNCRNNAKRKYLDHVSTRVCVADLQTTIANRKTTNIVNFINDE